MFKQRPPAPPAAGEDQQGPGNAFPEIPPLRRFQVTRHAPEDYAIISVVEVMAHEVELNAVGNILRFREFLIDRNTGPCERIVRCFNGWIEYEDTSTYDRITRFDADAE